MASVPQKFDPFFSDSTSRFARIVKNAHMDRFSKKHELAKPSSTSGTSDAKKTAAPVPIRSFAIVQIFQMRNESQFASTVVKAVVPNMIDLIVNASHHEKAMQKNLLSVYDGRGVEFSALHVPYQIPVTGNRLSDRQVDRVDEHLESLPFAVNKNHRRLAANFKVVPHRRFPSMTFSFLPPCGRSSVVEHRVPNAIVEGSNPFARFCSSVSRILEATLQDVKRKT